MLKRSKKPENKICIYRNTSFKPYTSLDKRFWPMATFCSTYTNFYNFKIMELISYRGIELYVDSTSFKLETVEKKEGLVMTSLCIIPYGSKPEECWDNDHFLLDLLHGLKEYQKSNVLNSSLFDYIEDYIKEENYGHVLTLLEEGYSKGFFDNTLKTYIKGIADG